MQDVIFYKFFITDVEGSFIEKTDWQENFWVTEEEANDASKYDRYDTLRLSTRMTPNPLEFSESVGAEDGF